MSSNEEGRNLVQRFLEGELSSQELDRLAAELSRSPELLNHLRQQLLLTDLLSQKYDPQRSEPMFLEALKTRMRAEKDGAAFVQRIEGALVASTKATPDARKGTRRTRRRGDSTPSSSWLRPFFYAAAAGLAVALLIFATQSGAPAPVSKEVVGVRARAEAERTKRIQEERLRDIEKERMKLVERVQPDSVTEETRKKALVALEEEKRRIEEDLRAAIPRAPSPEPVPPVKEPPPSPREPNPPKEETKTETMIAVVEAVSGDAFRVTKEGRSPLKPGAELLPTHGLEVAGAASRLLFRYPDRTRVELGPETSVTGLSLQGGKRIALGKGSLRTTVAKQPKDQPMVITTPQGEAKVVGTTLRIVIDPDPRKGTRLEVEEGKVELKNLASKTVIVEGGHYAVAAAGAEPVSRRMIRDALFVVDDAPLNTGDHAVLKRLEGLGFRVTRRQADKLLPREDSRGKAVVIISSTVTSWKDQDVREYNSIAVPVLTWEANLFPILGLTGPQEGTHYGKDAVSARASIVSTDPSLAAGLSGSVTVTARPQTMKWGKVAPTGFTIAAMEEDPRKALIFGYEAGALLASGGLAPERRAGLFVSNDSAATLTKEGWALFDAMVRWTVEKQPPSTK